VDRLPEIERGAVGREWAKQLRADFSRLMAETKRLHEELEIAADILKQSIARQEDLVQRLGSTHHGERTVGTRPDPANPGIIPHKHD
jgi:hypothetical protein